MKLGIYAIALNEEKNVERWLNAILPELRDGDTVTLVDTGSTDGTLKEIGSYGNRATRPEEVLRVHQITIKPWRFDTARNTALSLVPGDMDMCWSLDLDEFPQPGWREAVERAYEAGVETGSTPARIRYKFIWNFLVDGSPGYRYWADKLHARTGYVWKGIAHEWLAADYDVHPGDGNYTGHIFTEEVVVHHHQDKSVERNDRDMALMEKTLAERPDDARVQYYYGRQLYFNQRFEEAREWLQRSLDNPKSTWADERSQAMIYICWSRGGWPWLLRAIAEAPHRREPWFRLACWERDIGNYHLALGYAKQAASLEPIMSYIEDAYIQGNGPAALVAEIEELMAKQEGSQNQKGERREPDPEVHPGPGAGDDTGAEDPGGDSRAAAAAEPVGAV